MKHLKTFENYEPVNEGLKEIFLGLASIILSFGTVGNLQAKNNEKIKTELSQKVSKLKLTPEQQQLVNDFIKWCKENPDELEKLKQLKNKKHALGILIETFCDKTGSVDDGTLSDVLTIKGISAQIK